MNFDTPKARQVIRPAVSELWENIKMALGERAKEFFPIYSSRLSIFFNLDRFKGRPEFDPVLKSTVDLFIGTTPPRTSLCAAIDVHDRPLLKEEWENLQWKKKILCERYYLITPSELRDGYSAIVDKILGALRNQTSFTDKEAINESQWWAVESAYEVSKRQGYACLHEPGINSVIDVPPKWLNKAKQKLSLTTISPDYCETKVMDAVITTPTPDAMPLIAIEFDGPEHFKYQNGDYKNGEEKHATKKTFEKDLLQNEIFLQAKIPLIRIHYKDLPLGQSWEEFNTERKLFFGSLSAHLAERQTDAKSKHLLLKELLLLRPSNDSFDSPAPVDDPEKHSVISAMLRDSWKIYFTDEDDESVEQIPQYAEQRMDVILAASAGKIPHGFRTSFEEAKNLEKDETGVVLKLTPGRYLRLGGYTRDHDYPSVRFRLRVITNDGKALSITKKTFRQELAYLSATINALRDLGLDSKRAELHKRYAQGIRRALLETS